MGEGLRFIKGFRRSRAYGLGCFVVFCELSVKGFRVQGMT